MVENRLSLPSLGFGAFKIGRNEGIKYPHGYALPDETDAERILNAVLDLGIGYALALNDTLAISLALSGSFTSATSFPNVRLRQQDNYGLRFGLTSWLTSGVYIEPSVTFNLGGPDDGLAFGLTIPYTLGRRSSLVD